MPEGLETLNSNVLAVSRIRANLGVLHERAATLRDASSGDLKRKARHQAERLERALQQLERI